MAITARAQDSFSRFEYALSFELVQIQRYIDGLEYSIKTSQEDAKRFVDSEIWTDKSESPPLMALEIFSQVDHFTPRLFYRSSLTVLYTFFETTFHALTLAAIERNMYLLKLSDIKGQGILRDKLYLEKVVRIEWRELSTLWDRINDMREVRNHIAHDFPDSIAKEKLKTLRTIGTANKHLVYYEPDGPLEIESIEYLREVMATIEEFLQKVISALRNLPHLE